VDALEEEQGEEGKEERDEAYQPDEDQTQ